MEKVFLIICGLFVAFMACLWMVGINSRKKFLQSLEKGKYVAVYNEETHRINYRCIISIDFDNKEVLLADNKTYSFNELLD